jgi:hypothetical protein
MPVATYPIIEVIQVPSHVTIENISDYVGFVSSELISEAGAGMVVPGSIKYTVLSIREYVLQYQRLNPKTILRDRFNEIQNRPDQSNEAPRAEDTTIVPIEKKRKTSV